MCSIENVGKSFSSAPVVVCCSSIRCPSVIHWEWRIVALYEPKSAGWRGSPERNTGGGLQGSHFRRYSATPETKEKERTHRSEISWRKSTSMTSEEVKYGRGDGQVRMQWTKQMLWTKGLLLHFHYIHGHQGCPCVVLTLMHKVGWCLHGQQPWTHLGAFFWQGRIHYSSRGIRSSTASELIYQSNRIWRLSKTTKANHCTILELGRPEFVAYSITYLFLLLHPMMGFPLK